MLDLVAAGGAHGAASVPELPDVQLRTRLLAAVLDEIDYGLMLVSDDAQVLHANHVARSELDAEHPLQLLGRGLRARVSTDVAPLYDAIASACRQGLRRMVTLGEGRHRVTVAVVPLPEDTASGRHGRPALMLLGKRQVCEGLTVHAFARSMGLTPAETQVLEALCGGDRPAEIALRHGVALSTVRTQVGSIRAKTGAPSIGALLRQLAVLPPMVSALRGIGAAAT